MGGGLGIRYTDEQSAIRRRNMLALLGADARDLGCHLLIEPGRSIVAHRGRAPDARALHQGNARAKHFVIVDAAMNDFMRPALYGATHPITHVVTRTESRQNIEARRHRRPRLRNRRLSFCDSWPIGRSLPRRSSSRFGEPAPTASSHASNYNSRPRPAEVLVEGRRFRIIRKRESIADIMRGE